MLVDCNSSDFSAVFSAVECRKMLQLLVCLFAATLASYDRARFPFLAMGTLLLDIG